MATGESFQSCQACRFWDRKGSTTGSCRRHAPSSSERDHEVARWPETSGADGCGEGEAEIPEGRAAILTSSCKDCLFWLRPGIGIEPVQRGDRLRAWWEGAGFCRRFAPRPGAAIGGHAFSRITHATDHCFDGRRR
jgi:hypothetical protein